MNDFRNAVKTADDDYLTGLSNKGTLKRSYKDLESVEISANCTEHNAEVTVGDEKCSIVSPLAESKCTCPSRSICRHIITSILWLKKNLFDDEAMVSEECNDEAEAVQKEKTVAAQKSLEDELSEYSLAALQKAMKKRFYNAFAEKLRVGYLPPMEELSIITVEIYEDNATVKLISPVTYSACTCHSKELCKHKAAAILAWQVKHNRLPLTQLEPIGDTNVKSDMETVKTTAVNTLQFLSKLLSDGLVRASGDIAQQAESTAVMCHNSRLADAERSMREISTRLTAYIEHSPEFDASILFSLIMDTVIMIQKIIAENDAKKLERILGDFKSTYITSETLEMIPISRRHFSSAAGYEGEIYYFINTDENSQNPYLTYSDVRPTFYQTNRKKSKSSAPWGLHGSIDEITKSQLRLKFPKLSGGKISSSSETTAEIVAKVNLNQPCVTKRIYTDFSNMIGDIFSKPSYAETDRLVFIAPTKCISSRSDEITQSHVIVVEDQFGQRLALKLRYQSGNNNDFKTLVYAGDVMLAHPEKKFVIFGNTYIENGECFIYPISIFDTVFNSFAIPENTNKEPQYQTNGESGYSYFSAFFKNVTKMLGDMIQCGINSFDLYEQIFDYREESQKIGLLNLSQKLYHLYEQLKQKNHSIENDNREIITIISDIYHYLKIGTAKTEIQQAIENLKNIKEDN